MRLIVLAALVVITNTSQVSFSQAETAVEAVPPEADQAPTNKKNFFSQLNLSKEQKQKAIEIKKSSIKAIKEAKEAVELARNAYHEAFDSIADDTALEEKFRSLQSARQLLGDTRFQQMLRIRAILNDEQKKKYHELKAKFRKGQ